MCIYQNVFTNFILSNLFFFSNIRKVMLDLSSSLVYFSYSQNFKTLSFIRFVGKNAIDMIFFVSCKILPKKSSYQHDHYPV